MAENNQKLTLDLISKAHEKYANIKQIDVQLEVNGEIKTFKLEMYKYFSPVGIKECLTEFIRNMDYAKSSSKDGFGNIQEPYLMYLLIKHFTNLGETMPNTFKEQLASLTHMMNTSAFFQIMVHFDEEEIKKIREELEIMLVTFQDNYQIVEEIKKKAKGKIQNEDLLE